MGRDRDRGKGREKERERGTEMEMGERGREGEWGGHTHWDSSEHISRHSALLLGVLLPAVGAVTTSVGHQEGCGLKHGFGVRWLDCTSSSPPHQL